MGNADCIRVITRSFSGFGLVKRQGTYALKHAECYQLGKKYAIIVSMCLIALCITLGPFALGGSQTTAHVTAHTAYSNWTIPQLPQQSIRTIKKSAPELLVPGGHMGAVGSLWVLRNMAPKSNIGLLMRAGLAYRIKVALEASGLLNDTQKALLGELRSEVRQGLTAAMETESPNLELRLWQTEAIVAAEGMRLLMPRSWLTTHGKQISLIVRNTPAAPLLSSFPSAPFRNTEEGVLAMLSYLFRLWTACDGCGPWVLDEPLVKKLKGMLSRTDDVFVIAQIGLGVANLAMRQDIEALSLNAERLLRRSLRRTLENQKEVGLWSTAVLRSPHLEAQETLATAMAVRLVLLADPLNNEAVWRAAFAQLDRRHTLLPADNSAYALTTLWAREFAWLDAWNDAPPALDTPPPQTIVLSWRDTLHNAHGALELHTTRLEELMRGPALAPGGLLPAGTLTISHNAPRTALLLLREQ